MAAILNANEWRIRAPSPTCSQCGHPFGDGEAYRSRLSYLEGEGYLREDICERCFAAAPAAAVVSQWRGVYRAPPPPAAEPIRKETAESLLRKLIEQGDPARDGAVFVLSVMLERRRLLIERAVHLQPDGTRVRLYEHRGTGESLAIRDPGLRLDDLDRVQREVVELLGGSEDGGETAKAGGEAAPPPPNGLP